MISLSIIIGTISAVIAISVALLNWRIIKRHDFTLELYAKTLLFLFELQKTAPLIGLAMKSNYSKNCYQKFDDHYNEKIKPLITSLSKDIIKSRFILKSTKLNRIFKCLIKINYSYNISIIKAGSKKNFEPQIDQLTRLTSHSQSLINMINFVFSSPLNHPYKSYFLEKLNNDPKIFLKVRELNLKKNKF